MESTMYKKYSWVLSFLHAPNLSWVGSRWIHQRGHSSICPPLASFQFESNIYETEV